MAMSPQFSLLEGSCPTLLVLTHHTASHPKQVAVGPVIQDTSNPI